MTGTQAGVILSHIRGLARPADLPDRELLERFTARREGPAFEALVRRYGPMVLGVCRRVLGNLHDAEDAFQATFLVLARDADSIYKRAALGSWLYGVAYRVSAKARGQAARRRRHEGRLSAALPADPLAELTGRELITLLDEELHGLPERCRVPLVLCYFQGLTCDEAARRAGWPLRTFKRRLGQARERLRGRLARRGLALPAALSAAGLAQVAAAAVPANLAGAAVRAALRAAGAVRPGGAGAAVGVEMSGALAGLRFKLGAAALVVACLVTWGAVALAQQAAPPPAAGRQVEIRKQGAPTVPAPQKNPRAAAAKESGVSVSGRVLGADGKPLAGAPVALVGRRTPSKQHPNHDYEVLAHGKTDAEGRFRLGRKDISPDRFYHFRALAGAKGHGLGWRDLGRGAETSGVELRLKEERVLRGRLVDLQGLPAGKVNGRLVYAAGKELLAELTNPQQRAWQQMMRAQLELRRATGADVVPSRQPGGFEFDLPRPPEGFPVWPRPFTTDAQGRFEVRGLAPGQEAHLLIEDDRFARQEVLADTGDKKAPPEATLSLAPAQRIEGRVLYGDTGKPAAGVHVNVSAFRTSVSKDMATQTDAEGKFVLNSYPGSSFLLHAWAPAGEPYLGVEKQLTWPKGAVRQTVEFALPRGVEVKGKVTETPTGKPREQIRVYYVAHRDNETAKAQRLLLGSYRPARSGADGSYRLVVPPGPGTLLVDSDDPNLISRSTSVDEILTGKPGGETRFHPGVIAVNPKLADSPRTLDITVRRGVTLRGTVLGPDGKPVRQGVLICPGELVRPVESQLRFITAAGNPPRGLILTDGRFELPGCDPDRVYRVFALDTTGGSGGGRVWIADGPRPAIRPLVKPRMAPAGFRSLEGYLQGTAGAVAEISAAKALGGELTIRLQPCGSARIRLRDAAGKPLRVVAWVELEVTPDRGKVPGERAPLTPWVVPVGRKTPMTPDAEGRLTVRGLIPGATYRLRTHDFRAQSVVPLGEPFTVESGKTRQLPDTLAPQSP
jgi:RNA polymerase sigma factor (sigma-70 family)